MYFVAELKALFSNSRMILAALLKYANVFLMPRYVLTTSYQVYFLGASVTSWKVGNDELLFVRYIFNLFRINIIFLLMSQGSVC